MTRSWCLRGSDRRACIAELCVGWIKVFGLTMSMYYLVIAGDNDDVGRNYVCKSE